MLKEIWVLICSEFMLWSALHLYSDLLWICIIICSLRLYSDPFPETALWSVFWICILNDFLKPLLWPGFWIYVLNWFLTLYSELFPKIVLWICFSETGLLWICFLKLDYSEPFSVSELWICFLKLGYSELCSKSIFRSISESTLWNCNSIWLLKLYSGLLSELELRTIFPETEL